MGLKEYKEKRKFAQTPEPEGKVTKGKGAHRFVIQKHHASHLHYDFRLEVEGVLKSWAIPKGPSMNPADKRLAMMVEDHPMEYGSFEGIIPSGNYGAGTVMVWDEGTYHAPGVEDWEENEKALKRGLKEGNLKFILQGEKVKGEFALVRLKSGKGNEWLLLKKKDAFAGEENIAQQDRSVISGRTLDEIKAQSGKGKSVWHSPKINQEEIDVPEKAVKRPFFHDVKPMMATLVDESFDHDDWIFEIKWDGFRAIAEMDYNDVHVYSRNLLPFNDRFPDVAEDLAALGLQAIFDGEICAVDENGRADFQLIQNYQRTGKGRIMYYVFDLLYYRGYDLRDVPLVERKALLKKLIPDDLTHVRYSDHVQGKGKEFFSLARKQNLEGIVGKKSSGKYQAGVRVKDWLKIKIKCEQEAVVAGFTEPRGGRKHFGALVLGVYEGDTFKYIGHTGGGFNQKSLQDLYQKLKSLETPECPFEAIPKTNMPVTWVRPEIVVEVQFQEWTDEGIMRVPIFQGVRDDKSPREVKREKESSKETIIDKSNEKAKRNAKTKSKAKSKTDESEAENKKTGRSGRPRSGSGAKVKNREPLALRHNAADLIAESGKMISESKKLKTESDKKVKESQERISREKSGNNLILPENHIGEEGKEAEVKVNGKSLKFTNLKKVFWPEEGYTKEDLLEYYHNIASYILPYLKDRPENLRRNPNGYLKESFFQKDMPSTTPEWIETVKVYSESNDKDINYMVCQNEAALLYMVNLGCIEINPWLSRTQKLEYPDYMVIDLDPQDLPFERVIEVALAVKEVLEKGKIEGLCKTSGSRGLHIYIPLGAKYHYDQVKDFAELIASLTNQLLPDITSLERMPKKRKNKIYLDYLQNRKGQTLAAPYCVRPKPGATVSTPLEWSEVRPGLHPSAFDIHTIFKRLEEKGDLFKGIFGKGVNMEKFLTYFK